MTSSDATPIDIEGMGRICLALAARRTANLVTRHFNSYLAPLGLEVTQAVLLGLIASGKAESSSALARLVGIERSTLTRNLKPLEDAGLLRRRAEGRRMVPELTSLGHARLKQAYAAWQEGQDALTAQLDAPDAEAVRAHLKALRRAVHAAEDAASPENMTA